MKKQACITWRFFDKRISLEGTIDSLIQDDYKIQQVIPLTWFKKEGQQSENLSEALILVSKL